MASPLLEEEASDSNNASAETRTTRSGSGSAGSRPSFADYWKRTKQAARHITFVSSSLEQPTGPNKDSRNKNNDDGQQPDLGSQAKTKAQARRAQVRKAQIQHRERKANYTKQLEMDVAKLRDLIEQTERESLALRTENEGIKQLLLANVPPPSTADLNFGFSQPEIGTTTATYSSQPLAPEYTVSLLSSCDATNSPVYQVQRTSTPSSASARSAFLSSQGSPSTGTFPGAPPLSDAQTDHAINFILALEHICWNHFNPSHYSHHDYDPEAKEHGHIMMATSIALQSAPPKAWDQITAEKERVQNGASSTSASTSNPVSNPSRPPSLPPLPFESNYNSSTSNAPSHPHSHPHSHSHFHSSTTNPNPNPNPNPNILTSWPSPPPPLETVGAGLGLGLTLSSLHGLASALNPPDQELAPVQAWFEIARVYGGAAVQDAARMDAVRAELALSVECLHFGAVIQRWAFEDVVERVFGPVPGGTGFAQGVGVGG
ncbi:hypothetical protein F5Y13DRAFT_171402 [Hypoxylon sp. FL1857]|nr:hypothetical protein F5Y13DRAFT_171402 [Hypoxylon sp. FL1857]